MPSKLYLELQKIQQSKEVRRKLAEVADRIAANARRIAQQEGAADVHIGREDGTRPLGRSYARVTAPTDQEFGTPYTERRAILRRSLP